MLQIIENFLTSIFYNFPEMKGGSDKVKIIIRKKPEEKKIIRIKLSDYVEPKQKIIITEEPITTEPLISESNEIPIVEENPVKEIVIDRPENLTLGDALEDLERFNVLGSNKLRVLSNITLEALERRKNKLLESKKEIDGVKDLSLIDLEVEYIEIMKTKIYIDSNN